MNWIDSHSRVDEGLTVRRRRINRLLFAYDLVLVACSQHSSAWTRSVSCCVRKTPRYYVSLQTQNSACCKWVAIHCSRWRRSGTQEWHLRVTEGGARRLIHGLVKQTQFCVSFIDMCLQNRSFQTPQSCQFLNRSLFQSSSMVMNLASCPKDC